MNPTFISRPVPMILLSFFLFFPYGGLWAGPAPSAPSNDQLLRDAQVYVMAIPLNSAKEVDYLEELQADVLARGVVGLWCAAPEWLVRRKKISEKRAAGILDALRARRMIACFMSNSTFIMPDENFDSEPGFEGAVFDQFVARNAANQRIKTGVAGGKPEMGCLNNPLYRKWVQAILFRAIDEGAEAFHMDESYGHYLWGENSSPACLPGFCDDCCRAFRDYLRERVSIRDLRKQYGIEDILAFNYRDYLAGEQKTANPRASKLWPLFWHFQVLATKQQEMEIADAARRYAWQKYGRTLILNANQWGAGGVASFYGVVDMESEVYDFVDIGLTWNINHLYRSPHKRIFVDFLPPRLSYMPLWKALHAQDPDKPVVAFFDKYSAGAVPDFFKGVPAEQQTAYFEWVLATGYMSHGFLAVPWRHMQLEFPMKGMEQYTRFWGKQRDTFQRYFRGSADAAEVGVLYSYPSQLWDGAQDPQQAPTNFRHHYLGACMALTDARIGYRVIFLGDGEICPTRTSSDDLRGLKALIAPNCYAMTDENLALLRRYLLNAGGKVLATGKFASADGMNRPRAALDLNAVSNQCIVAPDLLLEYHLFKPDTGVIKEFTGQLERMGVTAAVRVDPPDTKLEVQRRISTEGELLIDLLTSNWVAGKGFEDLGPFTATVTLPESLRGKALTARLARPDKANGDFEPLECRVEAQDRIHITIPGLKIYGLVVITPPR